MGNVVPMFAVQQSDPVVHISIYILFLSFFLFFLFVLFVCFFRAASSAYGVSQARGRTEAAATGLHHSHSHVGSELHL